MSENDKFQHNKTENTALPYISNASIVEARPHWVSGSHDAIASTRGWMERRPGFSAYTADTFGPSRYFTWQRWDGAFYVMASVVNVGAVTSKVYKQKVGTDAAFVLLFTDSTTSEPFDYVEANNHAYFGNGAYMKKYDGTTLTNWGIVPPASVPTTSNAAVGVVPATIGHRYVYAYGVNASEYLSDVSDPSVAITTTDRQWDVSGPFCPDTQCDKVHIYRTEDGGSVYLELSNSPIANPGSGTWTIRDNDDDTALQQSAPAPLPGINAPPPLLKGFRFFAGRIWGFVGDSVRFSTFEENTSSVPEECFGQTLTNSRSYGAQVFGVGVTPDALVIFTGRGIFKIGGDSLNTFTYSTLSRVMGVRTRTCVAEFGDKLTWLDLSNTIQMTDGYTIATDDLSLPIRPDIASIDHSQASLVSYSTGLYRWLVLCDGGAERLRVFDLSMKQWSPPWNIEDATMVGVGQTAAGTVKLFLSRDGKPLAVNHSNYQDDGTAYEAELQTNLYPINKANPTSVSVLEYVATERNGIELSDVAQLTDEDYTTGTYTSLFVNEEDPPNRTPGTDLVEKWYWSNSVTAQRVSAFLKWSAANTKFVLYALDLAYRRVN